MFLFCTFLVCGARYKTRPGLTYHYTHSHKDRTPQEEESNPEGAPSSPSTQKDKSQFMTTGKDLPMAPMPGPPGMPPMPMNPGLMHGPPHPDPSHQGGPGGWNKFQENYLTFLGGSPGKRIHVFFFLSSSELKRKKICFAISSLLGYLLRNE